MGLICKLKKFVLVVKTIAQLRLSGLQIILLNGWSADAGMSFYQPESITIRTPSNSNYVTLSIAMEIPKDIC